MKNKLEEAIKITGKIADYWLPMKIGYEHTPGAVVCIAVKGVPKYVKAFGFSDIENKTPLKIDAQFRVASMSKMFTAVAIMQLQEQGKLRIDDKVARILPWFKGKKGKTDLSNVTIRQLLAHTSGIFRDGTKQQWINDNFPLKVHDTLSGESIIFDNGVSFKYSNHGYAVLGAVIEKITSLTYLEYVQDNIISPLKLKSTIPDLPAELPKKLVNGYQRWTPDLIVRKIEPQICTNAYASATGFISSANDLATFLSSLHPDSLRSVISRESRKEMQQVHGLIDGDEFYGLGLCLEKTSGQMTYGHGGGFAGFVTKSISSIDENIQIIILTNTQSSFAHIVADNLMRLVFKLKSSDHSYIQNEPYSGLYRNRWGDMVVISLGDDLVIFSPAVVNPLKAWSKYKKVKQNTFKNQDHNGYGSPGENITFQKIINGQSGQIVSDGASSFRVY